MIELDRGREIMNLQDDLRDIKAAARLVIQHLDGDILMSVSFDDAVEALRNLVGS